MRSAAGVASARKGGVAECGKRAPDRGDEGAEQLRGALQPRPRSAEKGDIEGPARNLVKR